MLRKSRVRNTNKIIDSELKPLEPFEEIMSYQLKEMPVYNTFHCECCEKLEKANQAFEKAFFNSNKSLRKKEALSAALDAKTAFKEGCHWGYKLLMEEVHFVFLIVFWCMEDKKDPHINDMMKRWDCERIEAIANDMYGEVYDLGFHHWLLAFNRYIDRVIYFCTPSLPNVYKERLLEIHEVIDLFIHVEKENRDEEMRREEDLPY